MNDTISLPRHRDLPSTLWLAAFVVSGVAYMALRDIVPQYSGWILKVLPILLLLQQVLTKAHGVPRLLLGLGLVFSAAGDILLSLDGLFLPGLGAFLLAQLTYTALFLTQFRWQAARLPWTAVIVAYALACSVFVLPETGDLRWVVTAYMIAISLMALSAGFRDDHQFLWVAVGALVFMVSDTLIAVNGFIVPFALADTAIMATYYLAQALIVLGVIRHYLATGRH